MAEDLPEILSTQSLAKWMNPSVQDSQRLQRLLVPSDPTLMDAYLVGPVKGEGSGLIRPISGDPTGGIAI